MIHPKRVFIFGAGFSKPAGMPLATELVPLLMEKLQHAEIQGWLNDLRERLDWLSGDSQEAGSFRLNIEQVFHHAHFDIEAHRLRQHNAPVGRDDGPGTPWNYAASISGWLSQLEEALRDVIFETDKQANLEPITRWATAVHGQDAVLTFNYDTLVERALSGVRNIWNHGTQARDDRGVPVCKLHGSIDWIVAHRSESLNKLDLLFDKRNTNRSAHDTGHVEDDYRLWRCRTLEQLQEWISGRDLQSGHWKTIGIAGLGAYKPLHQIPGLGRVWANGMRALAEADIAVIVGFSMSDFDAMAQMQFAEVARRREQQGRPLQAMVIDPFIKLDGEDRFRRVFRRVDFEKTAHEHIDWSRF